MVRGRPLVRPKMEIRPLMEQFVFGVLHEVI